MTFDVNDLALSEMMASTRPKHLNMMSSRAYTTVSYFVFFTKIDYTNLVKLSLHVWIYSFPLSDFRMFSIMMYVQ